MPQAEASVTLRQNEIRPVYGEATLSGGTLTISGTPTVKVYTPSGLAFSANCADVIAGPAETVQAVYTVDASDATKFPPGQYTLLFSIACTASDGIARTFEPAVVVWVQAAGFDRFSYVEEDLAAGTGSAAGRLALTRLLLSDCVDTDTQPAIYSDAEIRAYLALAGNDCYEAAAQAYEGMAASRGRVALVMSQQGITVHRHALKHLTEMAQRMRDRKLQGAVQVGTIDASGPDEHLDSYRQPWQRFDQVPEVR